MSVRHLAQRLHHKEGPPPCKAPAGQAILVDVKWAVPLLVLSLSSGAAAAGSGAASAGPQAPPPPAAPTVPIATAPSATAPSATAPSAPTTPGGAPASPPPLLSNRPNDGAAFQFALAKVLSSEGAFQEALEAFGEAARLAPQDPYVRIEQAQLLARLGELARSPRARSEYMLRAGEEARAAVALAADVVEVLRKSGEIHLEIVPHDPAALATAEAAFEAVRRLDPSDLQAMLTLGRIYLDRSQTDRAIEVLRELVRQTPDNRIGYSFLVEALLKAERTEEAEGVLREMLALDTGSLEARLTLAEVQTRRGDHRAALDTLLAAPEEVRADPQLRRQLASALYLTGDLDAALATADELLKAQPDNQYLSLLKGLILAAEGRNTEALQLLAKLREAEPRDLVLASTMARVLRREGRDQEAVTLLSGLAAELDKAGKPKEAQEARLELARLHAGGDRWSEVSQVLAPLLGSADPEVRQEALLLQADALVAKKDFDGALALLDGDAGSSLPSPLIAAKRAEVQFRAGKDRPALRQLEKLARADDPQSVLAAVQVYHRLEQYEASIPLLQRLVASRPLPAAAFLLGAAYERTGERQKAIESFRQVLRVDPDFHAALNYLGYMYAEQGENLDEAVKLVRRAVALDPDNGSYVDSLGWAHFRLGEYDRARTYLERATRLAPEDATVHEHLGDVYVALGELDKARATYRRALELDEENAESVRRKLERLPQGGSPRP
jgi:tetratricopeptide (TPR) repeat protein